MKLLKSLAAGLLAVSLAGTANAAAVKVYITGSTAFRSGTINALVAEYPAAVVAATSSPVNGANAQTFTGITIGSDTVTIKCSWSGSAAGIQTTAGNTAAAFVVGFLPDGATGTANTDPRAGQAGFATADQARPDITMADNLQSSTLFNGTFNGKTYLSLTDTIVGVVTFQWVGSTGFPAGLSMNQGLAQYLYGGVGAAPFAFFTGNNSDENTIVYGTGRDPDSGTRIDTFAESGIGVFSTVNQFKPTLSGSTITALALYPAETVNGVAIGTGNGGESSGGTLAGYMGKTLTSAAYKQLSSTATGGFLLVYLGSSDANTAITNGGVPLKWNGVAFSQAACEEGQYTFWGYEHLMYRSDLGNGGTGGAASKLTVANNLAGQIQGETDAQLSPNVSFNVLNTNVTRTQEGAIVTAQYF